MDEISLTCLIVLMCNLYFGMRIALISLYCCIKSEPWQYKYSEPLKITSHLSINDETCKAGFGM